MCVCVCAEAARCWQGSDIGPVALNSLCQLSQANADASITLYSLPSEWRSGDLFIYLCRATPTRALRQCSECMWVFVLCVFFFFLFYLCICCLLFSWSSCRELQRFRVIRPLPKVDQEAGPCRQWTGNGVGGNGGETRRALKKR